MKILFVIRSLENGGAERQLVALANELGRRRHSVTVVVFHRGGIHDASLDPALVRLVSVDKGRGCGFAIRLLRIVSEIRPEVVHGYLSAGNIAATVARAAAPQARLVWGIRDSDMNIRNYSRTTRVVSRLAFLLAHRADAMIFNSQAGLRYWTDRGCAVRESVWIPNGIDIDNFYPDREAGLRMRHRWGIPERARVVGTVGRFDPMKDHESFLRAAALTIAQTSELRAVIVGGNASQAIGASLKELAAKLGIESRVVWQGPTQDMRAVYNAFDVFCLSSSHGEGFPNVVGEAMACGRRCVVTDVGDAAFVAGDLGRVTPPRDSRALARAWSEMLSSGPYAPTAIRRRIVENFTIDVLADRTEQVLDRSAAIRRQPYCISKN